MAENDTTVVIIDDSITQPDEVIDLDKEYETEEGEIEEINTCPVLEIQKKENNLNVSIQSLTSSPEPETMPAAARPTFEVSFHNRTEYEKLGDAVLKALKANETLAEPKFEYVKSDEHKNIQAFGIETSGIEDAENKVSSSPVYEVPGDENSNDSIDFGADLNKLFTIDSTPSTQLIISEVPSYKRHSRDVLDIEVKPKQLKLDDNACPRPKPSSACFNCGSYDHGIRECSMPRNGQRIARAKRAHAAKGERYHVDVDQRFAHLKPGEITAKLRKALSLRKNELPGFFLRMRACGYPPGWLEVSKVSHSGLAMFNTNDDVLKNEENSSESEIKYDISKIIEFPGFNVMPEGYRDDYNYYNVPPYSQEYSKEAMIAALGDTAIKGFKRKKLKDHNEGTAAIETHIDVKTNLNTEVNEEMEIDDNIDEENVEFTRPMPPPLPPPVETDLNDLPPLPPSPQVAAHTPASSSNEAEDGEVDDVNRSQSPTLEELQAKQRDLLLKLTNGGDLPHTIGTDIISTTEPTTPATTPEIPTTPIEKVVHPYIIKTSHIGTPVLKFSPFDKIPDTDNFKVGVSDVINFENLPDSTGKYEAMKEVLSKVRQAKKRLAEDDD